MTYGGNSFLGKVANYQLFKHRIFAENQRRGVNQIFLIS